MIKLEADETLILEVRKHSFIFFVHSVLSVFFALVPLVGIFIFNSVSGSVLSGEVFWLEIFFYSLWLLIIWVIYFIYWTDYYLDVWYITDKRIYDVMQNGFFHRQVSILGLNNIQDITVETRGIIQTLVGFGNIHVQTAGETSVDFTMKNARNPNQAKDVISGLHQKIGKI